jgi:hypothetical protein
LGTGLLPKRLGGLGVKLTALELKLRIVELYLHSLKHLHGVVFN